MIDSFDAPGGMISRKELSSRLGIENGYDRKYSNDPKYSNMEDLNKDELDIISGVFNLDELKESMNNQMKSVNGTIYFIISFAALMVLIIVAVIANIVIEENKRTISLMKVMGYENKNISSIVLNIYTPFVIIAYILSIPVTVKLLKWIVDMVTKDINFAIPIEFSWIKAIIGLIGLLIGYYLAIALSKRTLNKVPLAIALKRE